MSVARFVLVLATIGLSGCQPQTAVPAEHAGEETARQTSSLSDAQSVIQGATSAILNQPVASLLPPSHVPKRTLPGGSWLKSCDISTKHAGTDNGWFDDYQFRYTCAGAGYFASSSWDNRQCPKMIVCNSRGQLNCGEGC